MAPKILTQEAILSFLRKNKPLFKEKFDVDNIILFGSYARGEQASDSDVDILIESKTKAFRPMITLKRLLEDEFKTKVDVIYIDSVNPYIMRFIKKEMIYA